MEAGYNEDMSIATKTGDTGETSLYSGDRVSKNHPRIEAVGMLDELNAWLGMCGELDWLQSELFDLGALIANPNTKKDFHEQLHGLQKKLEELEPTLPPLTNFILPGGAERASRLHVARTVCRRVERRMMGLELPGGCLPYVNRLSDYLFLLARKANIDEGADEILWNAS